MIMALSDAQSPPFVTKGANSELIGKRIRVWWPLDKKYYKGLVTAFNSKTGKHMVAYEDGDKEKVALKKERWDIVDGGGKPTPTPTPTPTPAAATAIEVRTASHSLALQGPKKGG